MFKEGGEKSWLLNNAANEKKFTGEKIVEKKINTKNAETIAPRPIDTTKVRKNKKNAAVENWKKFSTQ